MSIHIRDVLRGKERCPKCGACLIRGERRYTPRDGFHDIILVTCYDCKFEQAALPMDHKEES